MKIVPIYGRGECEQAVAAGFHPDDGDLVAFVRVPDDGEIRVCTEYGSLEFFCDSLGMDHVGPEALLSFAYGEDDLDFEVVEILVPEGSMT